MHCDRFLGILEFFRLCDAWASILVHDAPRRINRLVFEATLRIAFPDQSRVPRYATQGFISMLIRFRACLPCTQGTELHVH